MSDLSYSLLSWMKIAGKLDAQYETYQEFDNFDIITDAFKVLFPNETFTENTRSLIHFIKNNRIFSQHSLDKITLHGANECDPEVIESVFLYGLLLMGKLYEERLEEQIQMLDETAQIDLHNALTPISSDSLQKLKEMALGYSSKFEEWILRQKSIDNLKKNIDFFNIEQTNELQSEEQRLIKEINQQKTSYQNIAKENQDKNSNYERIKRENDALSEQIKKIEADNQETQTREIITSNKYQEKILEQEKNTINIDEDRAALQKYKNDIENTKSLIEQQKNDKEKYESQHEQMREQNRTQLEFVKKLDKQKQCEIEKLRQSILFERERIRKNRAQLINERDYGNTFKLQQEILKLHEEREKLYSELKDVSNRHIQMKIEILSSFK